MDYAFNAVSTIIHYYCVDSAYYRLNCRSLYFYYPQEEYAYIGTMISDGRQADVPANTQAYYKGILNCE
jgi:hypothetical protein